MMLVVRGELHYRAAHTLTPQLAARPHASGGDGGSETRSMMLWGACAGTPLARRVGHVKLIRIPCIYPHHAAPLMVFVAAGLGTGMAT